MGVVPVATGAVGLSVIWLWNSLFLARTDEAASTRPSSTEELQS